MTEPWPGRPAGRALLLGRRAGGSPAGGLEFLVCEDDFIFLTGGTQMVLTSLHIRPKRSSNLDQPLAVAGSIRWWGPCRKWTTSGSKRIVPSMPFDKVLVWLWRAHVTYSRPLRCTPVFLHPSFATQRICSVQLRRSRPGSVEPNFIVT